MLAIVAAVVLGQGSLADLTKPQAGISRRETSTFRQGPDGRYNAKAFPKADLEERSNSDNFRVDPGKTHTLMDVKGSGVITHIWMTFLGPESQGWAQNGSANHRDMLLRVYWDGNPKPAIEAPVGDFFANCFGKRSSVVSLPVIVEDADSYNCFWQMPFRKSARIEIVNQSDKSINLLYYNIDWIEKPVARDTPYFYAQYRQEYPVQQGKDYVILDTKGKGHYVGTVLSVRTRSPMWFGEGDEKIYIDGEERASIWGTGTEDYFLSAWGLLKTNTPYFGVPYFDQWGIVGGHTSAYRWHINDPFVFQKGIKVTMEHFGWISPDENPKNQTNSWNEREDDYASVAFWYQQGTPTFTERAPTIRQLPSIERITAYARDNEKHGEGETQKQQLALYDGAQILYMPPKNSVEAFLAGKSDKNPAWIDIPFEITKKEPLRIVLNMTTSYDFGRYQAYIVPPGLSPIPGFKLGGTMDFYSAEVENKEIHLLDFWPEPGQYTLRLHCVGKSSKSEGYYLGIESVRLRERRPRVEKWAWDREKDWRNKPVLYE